MTAPRVVIVGGGPAGMNAALALADHGVPSTIVDEGFDLGGQIYRPATAPDRAPARHPEGERLRAAARSRRDVVEVRQGAGAWGIFEGRRVALSGPDGAEVIDSAAVILASGASEFVPPFPGWTTPGVMTPGAAQSLVKSMGVPPGARAVVAGTGPFLLVVACQLLDAGVDVAAVLEATPRAPWLTLPLHGWRTPGLLADGLRYWTRLARAGVPLRFGRIVVAAHASAASDGALASVTHSPCDADWTPDRGGDETLAADTLCVGFGFVPRIQLAQMAGCALEHRGDVGGWVPVRDRDLATSVPGIFAAGDGAGVAGSVVAGAEGRLAGLAAAHRVGAIDAATFSAARRPIDALLARIRPLREALDRISFVRPGLRALVEDDTVVCRCEDVRWDTTKRAVAAGCTTYRSLKVATRIGMGACQGCVCWPGVSRLVAAECGASVEAAGPASPRPPARPVTIGEIAALRGVGP